MNTSTIEQLHDNKTRWEAGFLTMTSILNQLKDSTPNSDCLDLLEGLQKAVEHTRAFATQCFNTMLREESSVFAVVHRHKIASLPHLAKLVEETLQSRLRPCQEEELLAVWGKVSPGLVALVNKALEEK
jgi:hypothetical protein